MEKMLFSGVQSNSEVAHGFGARTILENVSFRLKKGEHIALVGANY